MMDADTVPETNCVRQPFSASDIGQNKSTVLINRINMFWGTNWSAIPNHFHPRSFDRNQDWCPDIVIGCVDTRKARKAIDESFSRILSQTFKSDKEADVVAIHPSEDSDGAWPSYDLEEDAEFDLATELAEHLVPGQVAVLLEVGAENLRYLTGQAIAVNAKDGVVEPTLSDIYRKAARAFRVPESEITRAEY